MHISPGKIGLNGKSARIIDFSRQISPDFLFYVSYLRFYWVNLYYIKKWKFLVFLRNLWVDFKEFDAILFIISSIRGGVGENPPPYLA